MAHESSSKARVFNELARSWQSSPYDENVYTTATGTSFHDVLHSTPLRDNSQHAPPSRHHQLPDPFENGSDGSAEMSIELGRGVKRRTSEDLSSDGIFNFGNDHIQYDFTATPPIPARNSLRKMDGSLRREASVRRATESTKANEFTKKATSDAKAQTTRGGLPHVLADNDNSYGAHDFVQAPATTATRNTRFTGPRQPTLTSNVLPSRFVAGRGLDSDHTPRRVANVNATAQSATFTANQSFMLPDIPDITELVSGVRKDGTPILSRTTRSRSRFTSGSFKPQLHRPVESLPLPEEEKAILVSLQVLKDRISELEAENSEAQRRADQFEGEVIDLRNQLQLPTKQLDGERGSDEDTMPSVKPSKAAKTLEASLKAVQDRFNRSERKATTAQISVQRIAKERDALITQIAAAYFSNEELTRECEALRESQAGMLAEINSLTHEVKTVKTENENLRMKIGGEMPSRGIMPKTRATSKLQDLAQENKNRATSSGRQVRSEAGSKRDLSGDADIASRIEQEVQKYREKAAGTARESRRLSNIIAPSKASHSRSKSQNRTEMSDAQKPLNPTGKRLPTPSNMANSEAESTVELGTTDRPQQSYTRNQSEDRAMHGESDQDVTVLSDLDDDMVSQLRRKIEQEHRARRLQKLAPIPTAAHSLNRKSSLKSMVGGERELTENLSIHSGVAGEATRSGKTVRVQSPRTSDGLADPQLTETDAGDVSVLSNTSRRRRRAPSAESMTSAFIIPDITLHQSARALPDLSVKSCIQHNAENCTACQPEKRDHAIPLPLPVSERDVAEEVTDATIRPAQAPALALATVIKLLEDEIVHLKLQREAQNRLYNRHDPAVSKRRRLLVKARLDTLTAEIEKRSDQVYALYDVLEGQRQQAQAEGRQVEEMADEEVEGTLMSIGIDPAELSGRVGRSAPAGLDGADDWSEDSEGLPWEGLSDDGSE